MIIKKQTQVFLLTIVMLLAIFCLIGCTFKKKYEKNKENIVKQETLEKKKEIKKVVAKYQEQNMELSVKLFKSSYNKNINTIVSPITAQMLLVMLLNGAQGNLQSNILKNVGMETTVFNNYIKTYIEEAPSDVRGRLNFFNSIWVNTYYPGLNLNTTYKDNAKEYLSANITEETFYAGIENSMNEWSNKATDGMVNKMIDKVNIKEFFYMFNMSTFDMDWEESYKNKSIENSVFNNSTNDTTNVQMMSSVENLYIEDNDAVGFIKNYYIPRYKFIGILPDASVNIDNYVNSLDSRKIIKLINGEQEKKIKVTMPSFEVNSTVNMKKFIYSIGLQEIYTDQSKLSAMFTNNFKPKFGSLYQTSRIRVGKKSTEGFVIASSSAKKQNKEDYEDEIILNRPFMYIIFDSYESIPIYMGVIKNCKNATNL